MDLKFINMIQFSFKNPQSVAFREDASNIVFYMFYKTDSIIYDRNKISGKTYIKINKPYSKGAKYVRDINTNITIECEGFIGYFTAEKTFVHLDPDNLNENIGENIGLCVYPFAISIDNYQIDFLFDEEVESVHGGYQIMDIIKSMDSYSKKFRSYIRKFMKDNTITDLNIIEIAKASGIRVIDTNSVDKSIIDKDIFQESLQSKIFKNVTV